MSRVLTDRERAGWCQRLSVLHDPHRCCSEHSARRTRVGVTVDSSVQRGVYLALDRSGRVEYVGMVARRRGTVAQRVACHHAATDSWDRLWVMPVADYASVRLVRLFEAQAIQAYDPPGNVQHRRRRAG